LSCKAVIDLLNEGPGAHPKIAIVPRHVVGVFPIGHPNLHSTAAGRPWLERIGNVLCRWRGAWGFLYQWQRCGRSAGHERSTFGQRRHLRAPLRGARSSVCFPSRRSGWFGFGTGIGSGVTPPYIRIAVFTRCSSFRAAFGAAGKPKNHPRIPERHRPGSRIRGWVR
jgi:hypothetical protein